MRLRQIALVARDLAAVEGLLSAALGARVAYRDPGVAKYGLHNALWALGGSFLEVVAPTGPGTTAGRFLDRRHGDGGYMFILDAEDLDARRQHFAARGVRMVEDLKVGSDRLWAEAVHLHPRDTGGCLLSVDRHGPDPAPMGDYLWAGGDWHAAVATDIRICGATLQCDDPAATAARWGEVLQMAPVAGDNGPELVFQNARARFVAIADGRGEGLARVWLACRDPDTVRAAAIAAGAGASDGGFVACGTDFDLKDW